MDTKVALDSVTGLNGLTAGEKLVMAYSGSMQENTYRWVTIQKVTARTVVVKEEGSYHVFEFRMKSPYRGAAERLESYGSGNYYNLYKATTPEQIALVDAAYAKRAQDAADKKAAQEEQERKRQEYQNKERTDALAANFGVEFKEIGLLGNQRYFAANVLNHNNQMCFVVVGVRREKEVDWDTPRDANGERQYKMVWKGCLNYAENRGDEYSIGTMASCSPDSQGSTLNDLFQNVIARVW